MAHVRMPSYSAGGDRMPYFSSCQPRGLAALTPREHQVMKCIAQGWANKVIAFELGISQRTAEAHRARIFSKLGVRNAVELVQSVWKTAPQVADAALAYGASGGCLTACRCLARGFTRSSLAAHYPARRLDRDLVGVSGGK
jgi:DNA-binding CsgD family transcriptional regulator